MTKLSKHDVILKAVADARNSQFKATAVKVELEAQLDRGHGGSDTCEYCDEGWQECYECSGNWEDYSECESCEGYGYFCGEEPCDQDHDGAIECSDCCGNGTTSCGDCDEGQIRCEDCDGHGNTGNDNWSVESCHDWIMAKLAEIGLAEHKEVEQTIPHAGLETKWYPKGALKYAEFYNDGSVDSEFTFTISLSNQDNIFLVPKVVAIFNDLANEIGNGINVSRAGMHMALINHKQCRYGGDYNTTTEVHAKRYKNFKRSMTLLLPALFFLASNDNTSRQLEFRVPRISSDFIEGQKYSAISYRSGALEFRAFETCYSKPDQVLDNFVVMSNCLKYWTIKYTKAGVEKIAKEITFGNDTNNQLDRLYCTVEHIDLLNAGLYKLKPAYMTIKECKQQRKFKTDKGVIKRQVKKLTEQAKTDYIEYEERFKWYLEVKRKRYESDYLNEQMMENDGHLVQADMQQALEIAKEHTEKSLERERSGKQKLEDYITERVSQHNISLNGRYVLTA